MMTSGDKLGEILMDRGLLTEAQVQRITSQQMTDERPFGKLATEVAGVDPELVWEALAAQLKATLPRINLANTPHDPHALGLITRTDAWTHHVLPLRVDGHMLVCATSRRALADAIGLLEHDGVAEFDFVLTDDESLLNAIVERYGVGYVDKQNPDNCRAA